MYVTLLRKQGLSTELVSDERLAQEQFHEPDNNWELTLHNMEKGGGEELTLFPSPILYRNSFCFIKARHELSFYLLNPVTDQLGSASSAGRPSLEGLPGVYNRFCFRVREVLKKKNNATSPDY